jgi:hypothetical protein
MRKIKIFFSYNKNKSLYNSGAYYYMRNVCNIIKVPFSGVILLAMLVTYMWLNLDAHSLSEPNLLFITIVGKNPPLHGTIKKVGRQHKKEN